ncbi:hypothetical protein GCM10020256_50050 [Streptomyces thermocoprophilus]
MPSAVSSGLRGPGVSQALTPPSPARQHVQGRGAAVPAQHGQRVREEIGVPVVEGETDQAVPRAPGARGEQLGHPDTAQAAGTQPRQLPRQAFGGDGDVVRVAGAVAHRVVHRHPGDRAGAVSGVGHG